MMLDTVVETIDELLEGAQDGVDDPAAIYKVRNSRQLLGVLRQRNEDLETVVDSAISDEEFLQNLRDLGYL